MATNYIQEGTHVTLTAPYQRNAGQGALVGSIFGVALGTVASGAQGEFAVEGVWDITKAAGAVNQGDRIYWDDTAKNCTTDPTKGPLIGGATQAQLSGDATVRVRLNESVPGLEEATQQARVGQLTDNSGGAAADGTIGAVTGFTPSVAWNGSSVYPSAADATAINAGLIAARDAIKELATKVNALESTLHAAGITA